MRRYLGLFPTDIGRRESLALIFSEALIRPSDTRRVVSLNGKVRARAGSIVKSYRYKRAKFVRFFLMDERE